MTVLPFEHTFECDAEERLLTAALRQKIFLRYGCKHGGCGTCRARLLDGEVEEDGSTFALASSERAQGWILLCSARPVTDCVIDVTGMELSKDEFFSGDPVLEFTAVLEERRALTADTWSLVLRLRDPAAINFVAGQFVNVEVPGTDQVRSYSMVNPPSQSGQVELVIKLMPGGLFSSYLENKARVGDLIRAYGPLGSLRVRPSYRKLLMVAGGSGLAPILAMLTDLSEKEFVRPVTCFFGARTEADLYFLDRIRALQQAIPLLEFVPVLESPPERWNGEQGRVTDALARRLPMLRGYDAYLCGPAPMVDACRRLVVERGVREANVYFDAFVSTGE